MAAFEKNQLLKWVLLLYKYLVILLNIILAIMENLSKFYSCLLMAAVSTKHIVSSWNKLVNSIENESTFETNVYFVLEFRECMLYMENDL